MAFCSSAEGFAFRPADLANLDVASVKRAEFEQNWTGRVVLMTRRASLAELIVKALTTGETFTALWQFYGDGLTYGIGSIKFADGTAWARTTMAANAWVRGTSGNDSITLPATGITADAGAGDDTFTISGTGTDRIIFCKGYGHDS